MEEVAYMVCMRVDELDDPVDGSTTTACVECGTDIWLSVESRKQMFSKSAMPLCSRCAMRISAEQMQGRDNMFDSSLEDTPFGGMSSGQLEEVLGSLGVNIDPDQDSFETLKQTARASSEVMKKPDDDWMSMCIMEGIDDTLAPPVPMGKMLADGVPKEVIAKQLIPAMAFVARAKRVIFGFSTWTLGQEKFPELPEGSLANHPDHKEALVLIDVTANGVEQLSMAEIYRDGISPPTLGEWDDVHNPEGSQGLFVDALVPVLQLIQTLHE